jgi:hypothetical protein
VRSSTRWRVFGALLAVACAAPLAGCDASINESPGGVRLDGKHVEFAVCDEVSGAELRIFGGSGTNTEDFMSATGDIELTPEEPLTSALPPAGVEASVWKDPIATPGALIGMLIYDIEGGVEFPNDFIVPAAGLSQTLWTRSNGRQEVSPCD